MSNEQSPTFDVALAADGSVAVLTVTGDIEYVSAGAFQSKLNDAMRRARRVKVTSRSARCTGVPSKLSAQNERLGQPSSQSEEGQNLHRLVHPDPTEHRWPENDPEDDLHDFAGQSNTGYETEQQAGVEGD